MIGTPKLIAGAMSGTSADGVDVAIVAIDGRGSQMSAKLLHHDHVAYPTALKEAIFAARRQGATGQGVIGLGDLAKMGREISLIYAQAVAKAIAGAKLGAGDLTAIAAHGQTLFHDPPMTIQWFDPSLLAAEVGCAVVSDFRRADCAAGGQGAPLVPFADYVLFREPSIDRVLLNIGGIANITALPAGAKMEELAAFDTGPGNCIIDHLCRKHDPAGPGYDPEGTLARLRTPLREPLEALMASPFFKQAPPKSTDAPAMIEMFQSIRELRNATFLQQVSTATLLTVTSIQLGIMAFLPFKPQQLIVSGGGTRNKLLMDHLRIWMERTFDGKMLTSDELGMPSEAKEAVAFALLGAATLDGEPSNVPSVTGAKRPVVLGSITPKP